MVKAIQKPLPDWLIGRLHEYKKIQSIPQAFEDSTHQLWRLEGSILDQNNHILKVCSNTESPFWQIMRDLFAFDLRGEIAHFSNTYNVIAKASTLTIPNLIQAETLENKSAFILTSEVGGSVAGSFISNQMVQQLANHLAELHSNPHSHWGNLHEPNFEASDWSIDLALVLKQSTEKWGGVSKLSRQYLSLALLQSQNLCPNEFIVSMPDLRWDQFLQDDKQLTALVDLDAFVYAPRELDFVILEYLLSADQVDIFNKTYAKFHTIPDISQVRIAYRLLLFYMQILGETDLKEWMNRDVLFSNTSA